MPTGQLSVVMRHLRAVVSATDAEDVSDGQLLERFVSHRDASALEALVHRHGPMVWGVCRRVLLNHHDAEDAFQATFLVLARKAASVHPRAQVGNWLYGVAHQTALKARATAAKHHSRERRQTEMPDPATDERDVWPDLQPLLDKELSLLPDRYRSVIVLCDLEGKTRLEAARLLRCPEGTINSRLARARTMLARRLSRCGLIVSGGALAVILAQKSAAASVPTSIVTSTVNALAVLAAGHLAVSGMISPQVTTLTEGVIKNMFVNKLKAIMAIAFVLATFGSAGSLYLQQAAAALEPEPPVDSTGPKDQRDKDERRGGRPATAEGFAGSWDTTFGPMTLSKDGNKVSGSYEMGDQHCTIQGKVARNRFAFAYQEPNAQGEGWFELSADGGSFSGKWRENGQEQWSDWTGTRTTTGFAGSWDTTFGPMTLSRDGRKLAGAYDMGGQHCTIEGKVEGKRFTFKYEEPNAKGEGWFELSSDGQSFAGKWRAQGNEEWSDWTGNRVKVNDQFAGTWKTTYGQMTLTQSGSKIYGAYDMGGQRCLIVGKIENGRFEFVYGEPNVFGEGWFEMSKEGKSFSGKWRENGASEWSDWTGERTDGGSNQSSDK